MNRPTALITGVGRTVGIGAGIARKLASNGWDVALSYWSAYDERMPWGSQTSDVEALRNELSEAGARVTATSANFEDSAAASSLMSTVRSAHGPISALVLSHCESVESGILGTTLESFERHFAVNTRASWQLIREFALQIPPTGGRIVALTSDHTVGNLPYGASKGALDRIVLAAAREFGDLKISSNLINPGPIDTGWMDESIRTACLARQPTGRLGTPEDIANLVSFLLSDEGAWINGQLLKADGGFSS
ncbi:SDR family oxidoreductase [Granulicella sp. dw_53]|uniref:SDR family oxidoreductase n=1 Tax=Granulicella sp. dw_53 TaxID=2719792 RepID=UPI001BD5F47E|nr:SDR family oxidoreductase [Granulicella sp. dw_53]